MERRHVLKVGAAAITMLSLPAVAHRNEPKKLKCCFRAGVASAYVGNSTWNLVVRADPRDPEVHVLRIRLEISNDPDFNQIHYHKNLKASEHHAYIIRTTYRHPHYDGRPLYFRFVAIDTFRGRERDPDNPDPVKSPMGTLVADAHA